MAVKEMHLAIYFQCQEYSSYTLESNLDWTKVETIGVRNY